MMLLKINEVKGSKKIRLLMAGPLRPNPLPPSSLWPLKFWNFAKELFFVASLNIDKYTILFAFFPSHDARNQAIIWFASCMH